MNFYNKLNIFTFIFFSTVCSLHADEIPDEYSLIDDVKNSYLKSFFTKKGDIEDEIKENTEYEKAPLDFIPKKLDDRYIREILFEKVINSKVLSDYNNNIYNKYLVSDINTHLGRYNNPRFNLVSRINRTKTVIGELTLASMLACPTTNIEELKKRQGAVKAIIAYKKKSDTLDKILNAYKKTENNITSFLTDRDPIWNPIIKRDTYNTFFFKNKKYNTVSYLGHYKMIIGDFQNIILGSIYPEIILGLTSTLIPNEATLTPKIANLIYAIPIFGPLKMVNSQKDSSVISYILSPLGPAFFSLYAKHHALENYRHDNALLNSMAHRLYNFSILLKLSKKITEIVKNDEMLYKTIGDKITYMDTLKQKVEKDKDLRIIFKLLDNKSSKLQDWSHFFDNAGYLLYAYDHINLIVENIKDAMAEIGILDAYCSCADLFLEHEKEQNKYTFSKYINHKYLKTPYIKINGLWSPFLDAKTAVPNNIEMGENSATQCRSMVITGPNMGGKSTFVDSAVIAIMMSQTLGFAAAREIYFTPFNKINTYIDVKSDVNIGKSSFLAEVDRSYYQYNVLQNLQEDEYSFSIFDEQFRGTNPQEGAAAEYSLFEAMAKTRNNLNIITTHFPVLTLLEEKHYDLGFRNFKVYITKDENSRIKFSYKIIPGKSKQFIAIDFLEDVGYKSSILDNAKHIVKNPKLYRTKFGDNRVSQASW